MALECHHNRRYIYDDLQDADAMIRVAKIRGGNFDDPIVVSFVVRELQDSTPAYEALSYTWGSADDPHCVSIDGGEGLHLPTTRNLETALRYLRRPKEARLIWIDAICINQISNSEKNRQVPIMGNIYSTASATLVWTGPPSNDSDAALALLAYVGSHVELSDCRTLIQPNPRSPVTEQHWGNLNQPFPFNNGELIPVRSLFERPYFSRVWIRQEITLSVNAQLICGQKAISWSVFRRAAVCVWKKPWLCNALLCFIRTPHLPSQCPGSLGFEASCLVIYELCRTKPQSFTFEYLHNALGNAACKNARDRIYGVLSLLRDEDRRLDIRVDYDSPIERIYTDVAKRVIINQASVELLDSCVLLGRTLELPSWVPDWSTPLTPIMYVASWSACAWISATSTISASEVASVTGIVVSKVERILPTEMSFDPDSVLRTLRMINLPPGMENSTAKIEWQWPQAITSVLLSGVCADSYHPQRHEGRNSNYYGFLFSLVRATTENTESLEQSLKRVAVLLIAQFLSMFHKAWVGKSLFQCANGHVGIGHPGVQVGDTVTVLLGSRFPIILRPTSDSELSDNASRRFKVVSSARVAGLMNGEAIYSGMQELGRPVAVDEGDWPSSIDGRRVGFLDTTTSSIRTNPADLLEEAGIKVESYTRSPHRLVVLPETLRAAGIPLVDFHLV